MTELSQKKSGLRLPDRGSRKAVGTSQAAFIKESFFSSGSLPLMIEPAFPEVDILTWAANPGNRDFIRERLARYGGILFRGFNLETVTQLDQFVRTVSGELLEYHERSSPRTQVDGNIYTSTDHPADQHIFLHNEQSYNLIWPHTISFFCMVVAQKGGETPIADCRKVFQRIDPSIRQRFVEKQYMYVRNLGTGCGMSWQTAFQTMDTAAVEAYCRQNQIAFEWCGEDRLRTRQVRPVVACHPQTREMTWFNHATFFHITTLEPAIRDTLLAEFREEDLPNNTYYGDGARIEASVLDDLRGAYAEETVVFPWQQRDLLMLDNMLTAHGRMPFVGPRKVVVAMSEPTTSADIYGDLHAG